MNVEAALIAYASAACGAQVEVQSLGVQADALPLGEVVWSGDPCRERPRLGLTVVASGMEVWRAQVKPRLRLQIETTVAAADLRPGEPVELVTALAPYHRFRPAQDAWRATAWIRAGEAVHDGNSEPLPAASQGADVTLIAGQNGVQITAPGVLLHDANPGDRVTVLNRATRVEQQGTLLDGQRVQLN